MATTRELPVDRLATTDETGSRIWVYPADAHGRYRRRRTALSAVLIVFFLVLPWLRIAGRQALLLDVPNRRFSVFGLLFWAHDAPMLLFVAGGAMLTLALATAVWGRVWCGWACPQTVFVDGVFRRIERFIEGDSVERRRLDQAPTSAGKLAKKTLKWMSFLAVSLVIGHSFLAYFVGTEQLLAMTRQSPLENPASFGVMAFMTGLVLFDFGWFREQFCTLVCPYGRFQSVMLDDRSQVVAYDTARGEPRRGAVADGGPTGDCVNCYRCVQVCPTAIDIRRGLQMECIACTACIDACDDVMARLKKPAGLIRYATPSGRKAGLRPLRARPLVYVALLALCAAGLAATVLSRKDLGVFVARAIETPYQETPTGVVNHFKVDLTNHTFDPQVARIALAEGAPQGVELVVPEKEIALEPGRSKRVDLFVRFPKGILSLGHALLQLRFETGSSTQNSEVKLVGPYN